MKSRGADAIDWCDIVYLARGNARQQSAFRALNALGIFDVLRAYDPVLTGTIPLGIDTAQSDLDVICEARDLATFERAVEDAFGTCGGFQIERALVKDMATVFARFAFGDFLIEIFAQPKPVTEQNAYRHMIVEARLLDVGGEKARQTIRHMKNAGLKTEPAFARHFGIEGDPYEALLELYSLNDAELYKAVAK